MKNDSLHQGHRERIRQRFLSYGIDSLSMHEIIEMVLFYPMPIKNTNDISHRLINKFKSIDNVLSASSDELTEIEGMGKASALFLHLIYDICIECADFSSAFSFIDSPESLCRYFKTYFSGSSSDVCLLLSMNQNLEIIRKISFTKESFIKGNFEFRKIARLLLESDCTRIAVGIHHAGNNLFPSKSDFFITKIFSEKFTPFGIKLIDTVICSETQTYSLRKNSAFGFEN